MEIGLLGLGTVGSGVFELLELNRATISKRLGQEVKVKRILVRDLSKLRPSSVKDKLTDDANDILEDEDIDIVVEVMGGEDPALKYIKEALIRGKHVVTANKEVIAKHGQTLLNLAKEKGVNLFFEASVAGGIPIIKPLKESIAANEVERVMGILNGTTNYILTQMSEKGESFSSALKDAQAKGFAEADPTDDVQGFDAARKLAIICSIAFNTRITADDVYTKGIDTIEPLDIEYAREKGYVIKLIGRGKLCDDKVFALVTPMFIKNNNMLSGVKGAFNGVMVEGNAVGPLMFYGQGAGKMPTASAVVADIMDVVWHEDRSKSRCTCYRKLKTADPKSDSGPYYVRLKALENQVSSILELLEKDNITASNLSVKAPYIAFITSPVALDKLEKSLEELKRKNSNIEIAQVIRVEEDQ